MTFSAITPGSGTTVGMSNPTVSVKVLDTAGHSILAAAAAIDGAPVAATLTGSGTQVATASFPTYDLTQGVHTVSVTFTANGANSASCTWTFTVAAPRDYTLKYAGGVGGSVVGSSTQAVHYGTAAKELEGFETIGDWNSVSGVQSTDSVNVLHGPTALKLTATPSAGAFSSRDVSLDLSTAAPFRLYFYLAQDPKVARPVIQLSFFEADWSDRLIADIQPDRLQQGWNCISLPRSEFIAFGVATWSDTFSHIAVTLRTGSGTCDASFDSLNEDASGTPMVAVTFDDGWESEYTQGFQYMASLGLPGTEYLIQAELAQPDFMTMPEVKSMVDNGWDVANHTWDHQDMTTLTQAQAQYEIAKTRDWLTSNGFGKAAADVAYPGGKCNPTVLAAMAAEKAHSGRTTDQGDNVLPSLRPYEIQSFEPTTAAAAEVAVARAAAHQSLVVLTFHQVLEAPDSTNTSISEFRAFVDYLASQPVTVVRVNDVIGHNTNDGLSVTAVPQPGHHFVGWSDGVLTATRQDLDVQRDLAVTARFAVDTSDIVPTVTSGKGTVTPSTTQKVELGGSRTFTLAPASQYHIADVKRDGVSIGASSSVTFENVTTPHTISVVFASNTPVYRFRNRANGFYLWTADAGEKNYILAHFSKTWCLEGVAYFVDAATNTSLLWRFVNIRQGYYLYTADPVEKASIIVHQAGVWRYEGPAYDVSTDSGGSSVWRFRNNRNGTYLYSADVNEKNSLVGQHSATWKLEGTAFYLAP